MRCMFTIVCYFLLQNNNTVKDQKDASCMRGSKYMKYIYGEISTCIIYIFI